MSNDVGQTIMFVAAAAILKMPHFLLIFSYLPRPKKNNFYLNGL